MAAAIIELDSLSDPIRPAPQDDDLLPPAGRGLIFIFVSGVKVRGKRLEFGCAGVHSLENRADP